MARKRSPARLVIALSVAAILAVFLLYTSIAGGGTPMIQPSELRDRTEVVSLAGHVVGTPSGDAHAGGLRFQLRDIRGGARERVTVLYRGSVPDLFRPGRDVVVDGQLRNGTFVAVPGSLITKCPSKYAPDKKTS
ncbi:MAG: cytochrome c maturation protein CcmE [Actinobacteria bacterium]|nr:cytochrome c maturation protein CcmE [Actinomycetota bacterium]